MILPEAWKTSVETTLQKLLASGEPFSSYTVFDQCSKTDWSFDWLDYNSPGHEVDLYLRTLYVEEYDTIFKGYSALMLPRKPTLFYKVE